MSGDVGEVTQRLENKHSFTYVTAHSPTFRCFIYVTAHSLALLSLLLRHRLFTYVTWRAAPVMNIVLSFVLAQGKYLRPFLYLQWHSRKQQILPHPLLPSNIFSVRFSELAKQTIMFPLSKFNSL